jgi:hypothetical protein
MSTLIIVIIASFILISIAIPYIMMKQAAKKSQIHFFSSEENTTDKSNNSGKSITSRKFKRLRLFFLILVLPLFFVSLFFIMNGGESEYSSVTFAIEKNGKNYIYSRNEYLVNKAIKQNEVPSGLNSNSIFFIDDHVYMSPNNLERVINILSGNYKIIDKEESSYSGYAVSDSSLLYNSEVQNKAGEKIGEIEALNIVTISSKSHRSKTMDIKWKTLPELEAIENCSVEGVWEVSYPYQGKTVTSLEDAILVNLDNINSFYGNSFELVYDEESLVLYFKMVNNN